MGEILCEGRDALANLQHLLTNDFEGMTDGQARYSPMCNDRGEPTWRQAFLLAILQQKIPYPFRILAWQINLSSVLARITDPAAMAILDTACAEIGTETEVEVRGRRIPAKIVELPFYKRSK